MKVLDFVQSGGPDLTLGSTVFELVMAFSLVTDEEFETSAVGVRV